MKKSKYLVIGFIFLMIFAINPITKAQYPTYQCAATLGGSKILKVTTVDSEGLITTMGTSWSDSLVASFGDGCNVTGAKNKAVIIGVYPNETVSLGAGDMNAFIVETEYWDWTAESFSDTPDIAAINVTTLYDPLNLQTLCGIGYWIPGPTFVPGTNVSMYAVWQDLVTFQYYAAADFLTQLPVDAEDYLADMIWDENWTVNGLEITYDGPPDGVVFINDYSATWEYDSVYGAFIRYTLKDNESKTIYQFEVVLPSKAQIPGFEIPVLLGVISGAIICVIYILMKRK
ncbi:MAG: hypothetical protein ACFFBC_08735 [Promethearchaeota archaeon]